MQNLEKTINYLENLSKLSVSPDEHAAFCSQINKILEFVDKLNELDTKDIQPTTHILNLNNVTRKDVVKPSLPREKFLELTPEHDNEFLKVPAVIKDNN